ncbi:hypothetical protein SLE2022_128390 [Rubroshorea leprosula]
MKTGKLMRDSIQTALSCDDILCDILLRLPPDTISKLIIVSKRWLHLICSHSFRHSYMGQWKVGSYLVGFFVCNSLYLGRPQGGIRRPRSEPALPVLSTTREGDDLKFSGILKRFGYFIDSCNGILLCGRHPKTYFVWDPVTKQEHKLPRPRVYFEELCMAFIVENCPDDNLCYKVIRAKCECRLEEVSRVTIETYSSKNTTWCYSTLTCSSPLSLCPWTVATVIGGVIHWYASRGNIAIFDPDHEEKHIGLIKLPGPFDFDEQVLGESSDGCLQYGWSSNSGLQIWVLEKEQDGYTSIFSTNKETNIRWNLRYKLNFKIMWKRNPTVTNTFSMRSKENGILSFLPCNSKSVFIRSGSNIFRYDFENEKVEAVQYEGKGSSILWDFSKVVPYFKPSWPQSSLCHAEKSINEL